MYIHTHIENDLILIYMLWVQVVENDLMGVQAIVRWLAYVPSRRGGPPSVLMSPSNPKKMLDPIDRKGAQFTCFTSTKVRMLTPEENAGP